MLFNSVTLAIIALYGVQAKDITHSLVVDQPDHIVHLKLGHEAATFANIPRESSECYYRPGTGHVSGEVHIYDKESYVLNGVKTATAAACTQSPIINIESTKTSVNENGEEYQVAYYNTNFREDFSLELTGGSNSEMLSVMLEAEDEGKVNDKAVDKRIRSRRGAINDIFDFAKDLVGDIMKGDAMERNFSIAKPFDLNTDLLEATQDCWGIEATEKVSASAKGSFKAEFGFHFLLTFENFRFKLKDQYIWIRHESDLTVGLDLDIHAYYANDMKFQIGNFNFKPFEFRGIIKLDPSAVIDVEIDGMLNADVKGTISTGLYYNGTTTRFDGIGEIIKHPKKLIGHPIKKPVDLQVYGNISADVKAEFTLDVSADILLQVPIGKDPMELVNGTAHVLTVAGVILQAGGDGQLNVDFENWKPHFNKPIIDGYSLEVTGFAKVSAGFDGHLFENNINIQPVQLFKWQKGLINIESGDERYKMPAVVTSTSTPEETTEVPVAPKKNHKTNKINKGDQTKNDRNDSAASINSAVVKEIIDAQKKLMKVQKTLKYLSKLMGSQKTRRSVRHRRGLGIKLPKLPKLPSLPIKLDFQCKKYKRLK